MATESSTPAAADIAYAGFSGPSLRNVSAAATSVTAEDTARPTINGPTPLPDGVVFALHQPHADRQHRRDQRGDRRQDVHRADRERAVEQGERGG
nr:hypothetical protein [Streptomyces sp. LUP30]